MQDGTTVQVHQSTLKNHPVQQKAIRMPESLSVALQRKGILPIK